MEYVFDIETDGFDATKIHVLSVQNTHGVYSTADHDAMRKFFAKEDAWFIGHNIFAFDIPVLERLLDIKIDRKRCFDTLYLSRALFPERTGHGLDDWDSAQKVKVDPEEWKTMSYERARVRCEADTNINWRVWKNIKLVLMELYDHKVEDLKSYLRYMSFKADCASRAEQNGWTLDRELAEKNLAELTEWRDERFAALEAELPERPIIKKMKRPEKMYKKDTDELTVVGERWYVRCKQTGTDPDAEVCEYQDGVKKPSAGSVPQLKEWLFSLGWKPSEFKFNKDSGKEVPQINCQDPDRKGEVSDSVMALRDKAPEAIDALSDLSILKHRVSILEGFLDKVRDDGRIPATVGGLTNTLRFTHSGAICNLPGVAGKYGDYVRPCLIAGPGKKLMGADLTSLEDRTKQHYMWDYDPEYVKTMMADDFDPHLDLALVGKAITEEEIEAYKQGGDNIVKSIKPIRTKYKTVNYASTYGAGGARIATAANVDKDEGFYLHKVYWERNWAIKAIASDCKVKTDEKGQMWLFNPVSKMYYELRHDKDRFSTLNQGTGSFIFDCWLGYVLQSIGERGKLIAQFHDEFIIEVDDDTDENELRGVVVDAVERVNRLLKLNRSMGCDVQFGEHYGQIH